MTRNFHKRSKTFYLLLYLFTSSNCMTDDVSNTSNCQLWHFPTNGYCRCGARIVNCDKQFIYIKQGTCLTWNNATSSAEAHRCLFTIWSDYTCVMHDSYRIPATAHGEKLNYLTCSDYNRQGRYCRKCVDGYGPALFSDVATCADCSKHRHLWILNLMFQLFMVTILCLLLVLFQIKGASSPFNVIITYAQLAVLVLKVAGNVHARLVCYIGRTFTNIVLTSLGVFNLDFFHAVIPPLCISPLFKSINVLLFDYVIASYPLFLTMLIYLCIEVYNRQHIPFLSRQLTNFFMPFNTLWNPKKTILNTFATILLLSYLKLLFTSIHLLLAFQSYNSHGQRVSPSALLLYDPNIRFFHSEHIPYAMVALLTLIFILLLPLLLLLYPTSIFKKCLTCLGFRRWNILHHIMDIFQGWYKDGTEGTRDYRSLSALYLLFRVALSCELVFHVLKENYDHGGFPYQWVILGILNIFLGMIYFILQPYKQNWMSRFDGWILTLIGSLLLLEVTNNKSVYILGGVAGITIIALLFVYAVYHKYRNA